MWEEEWTQESFSSFTAYLQQMCATYMTTAESEESMCVQLQQCCLLQQNCKLKGLQ